jgi:hypothetical protein
MRGRYRIAIVRSRVMVKGAIGGTRYPAHTAR